MKKDTYLLFAISALIILFSCRSKVENNVQKVKTEKTSRYLYKLGVPEKNADETTITQYNIFGNPTEETSTKEQSYFNHKRIYVYEKDSLLVSQTEYRLGDNTISYKENIVYNENGTKESMKAYMSFGESKMPELVAGMKFYYDANNRISLKRFFGEIDYKEEVNLFCSATVGLSVTERENKRKADSSTASYMRNGKGDLLQIYFKQNAVDNIFYTFNDTDKIVYSYSNTGKILSKQWFYRKSVISLNGNNVNKFSGTKYYYGKNDDLVKKEDISGGIVNEVTLYNSKKQRIEVRHYFNGELSWKWKYIYYDNGKIKDVTKYNNIEEPEFVDRFEYEYY